MSLLAVSAQFEARAAATFLLAALGWGTRLCGTTSIPRTSLWVMQTLLFGYVLPLAFRQPQSDHGVRLGTVLFYSYQC